MKMCTAPVHGRSLESVLSTIEALTRDSSHLSGRELGPFEINGTAYSLPRLLILGEPVGHAPQRLGLFAGLHGNAPASVYALLRFARLMGDYPEVARGYCLFIYPLCNPTGFEDNTPHSRRGHDLNHEFRSASREPEIQLLQAELNAHSFHGVVSLEADNAHDGISGYAGGSPLSGNLLEPALEAAGEVFARDRVIRKRPHGGLSATPKTNSRKFDIALATPQDAPQFLQEQAILLALGAILNEYRRVIPHRRPIQ